MQKPVDPIVDACNVLFLGGSENNVLDYLRSKEVADPDMVLAQALEAIDARGGGNRLRGWLSGAAHHMYAKAIKEGDDAKVFKALALIAKALKP